MIGFWKGLSRAARAGLLGGMLVIALTLAGAVWWVLRVDYQVLFADLKPQDVVAMTAELEKQKIPYRLGEAGGTILVDKAQVLGTRLKLMGKELPLQGAVGFELFNNTDFGMTEFAQKINYQRALQGELTRTILSLAEIREVRVHLALPEQGLFKQATSKAKAAISLTMRPGQNLRAEQVLGIQRLVAAATPGMMAAEVTVVDHQGVALSRAGSDTDGESGASAAMSSRLDLKKETENYLTHKAALVLERSFGPGQALASVDVTLNMDQVRTTTEDVIAAPGPGNQAPAGVKVRERESIRDAGLAPLDARGANASASGNVQREVEYQVGRRVEQVVSQPGSIRRIQVLAVVRQALSALQEEQLRRVIAAAVGASVERGDAVVVQSLGATSNASSALASASEETKTTDLASGLATGVAAAVPPVLSDLVAGAVVVVLASFIGLWARSRLLRRRRDSAPVPLSAAQREAALLQVQLWMQLDHGAARLKP